jgi:tetratricopeptide (TPR) repeat protein
MICNKTLKENSIIKACWHYLYDQCPRGFLFFIFSLFFSPAGAQPWAKKASQAVFTLKTFKADGSLLGSANGFFVSEQGEAVSPFTPFKGAQRAVAIDAQGKEWPVDCIMGANGIYDVAKFQVSVKKTTALTLATTPAGNGSTVWLLPYSAKKAPACQQGTVSQAQTFEDKYTFYTLSMQTTDQYAGCPVLNDDGQVLGILQPSASATETSSYAVSAAYANALQMSGFSLNDPTLQATAVPKALPDNQEQALLTLLMASSAMTAEQLEQLVERFIAKFPQVADGYIYRARIHVDKGEFAAAEQDMQQAIKVSDAPDNTHYQYAQLIYQKVIYQTDKPHDSWTLERALQESQEAYRINPEPVYRLQQAQLLYAMMKYADAYAIYEELQQTPLRNAENFYAAAQCKIQLDENKAALALLDSAVSTFSKPYTKTVIPYLRLRAQLSMDCRRYQQAINDMQDLVALEPSNTEMWAEKAHYELRVSLTDQALESATECIRLAPDNSSGYLLLGIAQCIKGLKQEGLQNLTKAKELGDGQAQKFIDKYSN